MVQFDDVLKHLGEFGRYQIRCYLLICLLAIAPAMHMFSQVFLVAETDHWCYTSGVDQYTDTYCGGDVTEEVCNETWKNYTIPYVEDDGACGLSSEFSQCERYNTTGLTYYPGIDMSSQNDTTGCVEGWDYDRSVYKSTAFQEFDLVCDDYYLGALSSSIYMCGVLVGAVLFGALSDMLGRLPSLMMTVAIMVIFGTAVAFSPNYIAFVIFRFFVGLSANGMFLVAFVLATELVGPSKRTLAGIAIEFFFSFGYMLISVLAYFIRYWWQLQLVITVPNVIFLLYLFILPESPRWLLSKGKSEKAEKVIRECAKYNGVNVPDEVYEEIRGQKKEVEVEVEADRGSFVDLFRLPNMRAKSFNIFYNWFTNSFVYYGLSLNTSNLGGNDFLAAFISAAVEVPAYIMSLFILDSPLGRRWSLSLTLLVGGIACLSTLFVPACDTSLEWLGITLSMTGKFAISASFAIVYVFSAELYPTPVRNIGMGISSMCARIGGILAPQMLLLGNLWEPLPLVVFGSTAVIAGLLTLLLPETLNKKLPETLEEGEAFGKKKKKQAENSMSIDEKDTNGIVKSKEIQVDMETKEGMTNNGFIDLEMEKIEK
ncbi:organic cation transporter protein-like [Ptychodera flava]|uniref:organic cation transporter protein-like n=1 Tax=Ptychodera flava TaxID=63121 RepID=UPI003969E67F